MKKVITEVLKTILFAFLLLLLIGLASKVLIRKDEYIKYADFYSEKDSFDVLFFGSSRVLDAVQPMELYQEYGLKTYNMAQHNETLARNYYSILNAIKYNKPKVIVVDVSWFSGEIALTEEADSSSKAYLHNMLDHMPLSLQKINIVNELCSKEIRAEYLFPFFLYHSRWNELTKNDFNPEVPPRKGAEVRTHIERQNYVPWPAEERSDIFIPEGINLDKIIDLCKSENIELLFICLPVPEAYYYGMINTMGDYFKENDVLFVNYWSEPDLFDYEVNFSDGGHLNLSGAQIVTKKLGEYLTGHYTFDEHKPSSNKSWDKTFEKYLAEKESVILESADNPIYLLMKLIEDDDFYSEIEVSEDLIEKYRLSGILNRLKTTATITTDSEESDLHIKIFRKADNTILLDETFD